MAIQRQGPGFATLNAALAGLDGVEAKSGWFETARYPDKKSTPVAYVAAVNEFGALTHAGAVAEAFQAGGAGGRAVYIPARPFMRPTVAEKGASWMAALGQGAAAAMKGKVTPAAVMEIVALRAAADVAITITKVFSPPNAPSTIRRKGHEKPLEDSKRMYESITAVVEKK